MNQPGQVSSLTARGEPGVLCPRKRSLARCAVRFCSVLLGLLIGLPTLALVTLLAIMVFRPLDVTPLLRPLMPIVIVKAPDGAPPRGRLAIGHAELRWSGLRDGFGSPMLLRLNDVTILDARNVIVDRIRNGAIALDAFPLLHGRLAITNLQVEGARIALLRDRDGSIDLDLGDGPSAHSGGGLDLDPTHLHRLALSDTRVELNDKVLNARWVATPVEAMLTPVSVRWRRGLSGTLRLGLSGYPAGAAAPDTTAAAPFSVTLFANGALKPDGTLFWHAGIDPTVPAGLAAVAPSVADGLAAARVPVGLSADVTLAAGRKLFLMMPRTASITVPLGKGEVDAAGSTLYTESGLIKLRLSFQDGRHNAMPARLAVDDAHVLLRPPPPAPDSADKTLPDSLLPRRVEPRAAPVPEPNTAAHAAPAPLSDNGPAFSVPASGPTLTAGGGAVWADLRHPAQVSADADVRLSDIKFAEIGNYWPVHASKGARKWVTENVTSGSLEGLHVSASLAPGSGDKSDHPKLTRLSGGLDGRNLDVHWLRPIDPLHEVNAHLELLDPTSLIIHFDHGYQIVKRAGHNVDDNGTGRLQLLPGSMTITGLDLKDQTGIIDVSLDGDLRDHLALLAEPRLHILSRHPVPFRHPSGHALVHSVIQLPLVSHISTSDMTLDGNAQFTHVHLGTIALGHDVDNGTFEAHATMQGMTVTGSGLYDHIPTDAKGSMDFDSAPPPHPVTTIDAQLHLTPEAAVQAGLPVENRFDGRAELAVNYASMSNGLGTLGLHLDLKQAGIHIPMWSKPVGAPANAMALLNLAHGSVDSVQDIQASGPDLAVHGEARLRPNVAPVLEIPDFRVGRSNGSARITLPMHDMDAIDVNVRAQTLDLSPLVQGPGRDAGRDKKAAAPKPLTYHVPQAASGRVEGPPSRPWLIDLTSETLYYSPTGVLGGVTAHLEHNGVRLERMRFSMTSPTPATAMLEPVGMARRLTVNIPNLGQLAAKTDLLKGVEGGSARIDGRFDDSRGNAPFRGRVIISPFVIKDAPRAMLLARNLSVYGLLGAHKAEEFAVDRFDLPVSFADGVLRIEDGRAGNSALGATIEGPIDLDHGTLDLSGTIVPAFAINALPGKLPGIGRLFAPEKDGGFLAVKFALDGQLDAPDFKVSPLSILLPGVMRDMF